jgi:serralysin
MSVSAPADCGGTNADTMAGGLGDDSYFVDNAGDQITEAAGEGIDNVISSLFAFTLSANFENIQLIGAAVAGTGNGSDNVLTGNALNNSLVGLGGNDVMLGGPGADTMFGGLGDDSYYVDDPGDVAGEVAGEGVDTIHSSLPLFTLAEPFEVLFLEPGATSGVGNGGDNTLVGNAVANFLIGNDGNDTIFGEAGADVMVGGRGVDVYYVDVAGDLVIENPNEGADVLVSAAPVYTLPDNVETLFLTGPAVTAIGNNDDNTLAGTAGVNFLLGGGGNDTFNGGGEADFLVGGAGIDVFLFTRTQANGDTVTDFTPGTDHIGFIGYGAGSFT